MSGPWQAFSSDATDTVPTNEGPWEIFRIGKQPQRQSPGAIGYLKDIGEQAIRGINKGLVSVATAPYRALDWAAEKISGGQGLPDVETMPIYKPFLQQLEAQTTPGQYAGKMGEAVGATVIPTGALLRAAPVLAAIQPTTTTRAIGQVIGQNVATAPGATAAIDIASAASGGAGVQAAENMGYGPAGQTIAGMLAGMMPGIGMAYRTPAYGRIGTETGENIARARANETVRDAQAFSDQEVRPFGPAFNQGPVASIGKQLTETPLIGAPLKNNLDETYQDAARATARLADLISPTATPETAGLAVQRGLNRFRTAGIADLEPAQLQALNVPVTAPVPRNQVMSAGAAQTAAQAAPIRQQIGANMTATTRGAQVPAVRPLSQSLMTRTSAEHLDDAQLNSIIRAPASDTSFAARQEALYERAWRMVPTLMRENNTVNHNMVAAVNTRQALGQIDRNIANQISGQARIGGDLADRLRNARAANFPLADLRAIRTEVGRALSNTNPLQQTLNRSQLRQLYGAISRDIETGLETLANRAAIATQRGNNAANRVSIEDARRAAGALTAFRTADRYTRQGMDRMERFMGVLQAQSPEAAARRISQAALDGGRGNIRLVRSAMSSLRPEERAEFASLVTRQMGDPVASARGIVQEAGWSAQSFVTRYQNMSADARNAIFTPEHQRALDQLFRVSSRIANVEALANTSRSGTNTMNMTALLGGAASAAHGDIATPLAIGATGLATSVLMSRPSYVRWMTEYVQLRAAVRSGVDSSVAPMIRHIAGLEQQIRANPQLAPVLYAISEDFGGQN